MATKKKKIYVSLEDVAKLNKNTTSTNPLYQLSNPTKEMQDYDNFAKKIDYSKVYAQKDNTDFGLHWSTPLDILKNTVGLVGGAVTTGLYNRIKDVKKFSQDPSLLGAGKLALDLTPIPDATKIGMDAIKGQKKAWTDNKYSWSDVPLVGALKGIGDKQKYGEDVLNEVGMKEGIGRTALGVGLDIALDPLTYLTGGAATASKMGKIAEAEKIANVADDLGVVGKFKNIADFTPEIEKALIQKHPNLVRNNPELFDKLVTKKLDGIDNARNIAYNANINKRGLFAPMTNKGVLVENLPVPFVNKLGNVAEKSLLFRSEAKVKPQLVDDLITKLTQNGEYSTDEVRQMIKNKYGTDELTKNQFSNLYDLAKPVIEKNPDVSIAPTGNMETKIVDEILKGDKVNYEKDYSGALKTIKNKEQRKALSKILDEFSPEEFAKMSDEEISTLMDAHLSPDKVKVPDVKSSLDSGTAKELKKQFNSKSKIKTIQNFKEEVVKESTPLPKEIKQERVKTPDEIKAQKSIDKYINKETKLLDELDEAQSELDDLIANKADARSIKLAREDVDILQKEYDEFSEQLKVKEDELKELTSRLDREHLESLKTKEPIIEKKIIKKSKTVPNEPVNNLLNSLKKVGLQKLEEPITKQLNLVPVEKQAEVMEKLDKAVSRYDEVISEFRRNAKGKASLEKVENQGTEILHREVEHIFNSYVKGTPEELLNKQKRNVNKLFEGSKTEMGDFKTKFEQVLDKKNPFNARTLKSNDKLLNNMGDVITDAESEKAGYIKFHQKALNEIKTDFEKLATTEADKKKLWEEIGYVLEKEAPRSYGENWKAPKEVQAIAEKVKDVLGKVGQDEIDAGVLKGLNENYFMHNVNQNHPFIEKGKKALKNKISEIRGKKASNVFGQKREGFQTLAEWRNKIEDLQDELKNLTGDANKKKRLSIHREIDFLNDLYDLSGTGKLQERVNASASAINNKKMFDELRKFGMFAEGSEGIGKHDLVPFNTLAREMNMTSGELANKFGLEKGKTYRMSREVFEGLKRNNEIFKSENVEKAMNGLDKVSDAFRALTTYYKPSHFTNNALGNVLNNAFFGVKPSDYTGATKLLKGYANGTLFESESKIMELAFKKNIISGGSYVDIKESNLLNDNPLTRFMRHGKFTKEGAAKGNRLFSGEMIEDVSRLANFLNGMNKYGDVSKAAKQVREALFNYNELSNADRKMRRLIPFWNWTKNNLPLQVKQLMENPKYALNIQRFKDTFNKGQEGEDWQKEYGVKLGDRYYSFQSPTNDLNFFDNPIKALASGVTPPLRMPIEWYANKKIYTGKPISYPNGSGVNGARMEDLPSYLFSNFGILKNANDLMSVDEKSKKTKKDVLLNLLVPNTKINK